MKTVILISILILVLSCNKVISTTSHNSIASSSVSDVATSVSGRIPVNTILYEEDHAIPCLEQDILLTGEFHYSYHYITMPDGKKRYVFQISENLKGVGQITGDEYTGAIVDQTRGYTAADGSFIIKGQENFILQPVGKNLLNNIKFRVTILVTIDSDGNVV